MNGAKATHIIVNNLGGITSLVKNLVCYKGSDALTQELIVLNINGNKNTPADFSDLSDCLVTYFDLDPKANWYHTYKRLAAAVGKEQGVIVSNDVYDLIMASRFKVNKKIVQLVHDAYNLRLSLQYEQYIDAFICHSEFIYDMACQFFPHRKNDIHLLYYGIPMPNGERRNRLDAKSLKLFYLGRHDKSKGVYDLHAINELLKKEGVKVEWTILGKGPETETLKTQWANEPNVCFQTPSNSELYQVINDQDVFVFPTKFEGFPVALVESMSLGCVPVASNLPGGIRELVNTETGYRCALNDHIAFANAIFELSANRTALEMKSEAAFSLARARHNAIQQTIQYQDVFKTISSSPQRPAHHRKNVSIGSRLDKQWIPNQITKTLRNVFNG